MKKIGFLINFFLCLLFGLQLSTFVFAHGGRTDSNGGHYNKKTGEYHFHNSGESSSKEKDFQEAFCLNKKGKIEYVLDDSTRVDCLTEEYAIEIEFAKKWAEAIGQSLYYAGKTNKKAGIVIIMKKSGDEKYFNRLIETIEKNKLNIKVWQMMGE